jgi:hypothetical protein
MRVVKVLKRLMLWDVKEGELLLLWVVLWEGVSEELLSTLPLKKTIAIDSDAPYFNKEEQND